MVRVLGRSERSKAVVRWRRCLFGCSGVLLGAVVWLIPFGANARDLVLYGEPTLERALRAAGLLWQARTGTRVNVFVAPSELSYQQIWRGARCDVIVAPAGAKADAAAERKVIDAGTIRRVFGNRLLLVGTDQAGASANASLADIARLVAGRTLAIASPDRDLAGAPALALLRKLGIDADAGKGVAVAESTGGVVNLLMTGKAALGIVFATDAVDRSFKLAAPLPDQPAIEFVVARSRDPQLETGPFMAFLESPQAKAAFKSAGLDPPAD